MAVQYVQNKSNPLGTLGGLAMLGGTLTGQPWLTSLGTGMTTMNQMMKGQGDKDTPGAFQEAMKGVLDGLGGLMKGNVAKTPEQQVLENVRELMKESGY